MGTHTFITEATSIPSETMGIVESNQVNHDLITYLISDRNCLCVGS